MAFHNPYHFVPVKGGGSSKDLSVDDFKKENVAHVTHDRYTIGDYSGRILCELTAETAFVVGDKHNSDDNKINPTEVEQYKLDGLPAIPASTIRGLISNIVETASNSSLRVLNDEIYSYRKKAEGEEILKEIGLVYKLTNGTFSLLPLCNFLKREPKYCFKIKSMSVRNFSTFGFNNKQFYYFNEFLPESNSKRIITEQDYRKLEESKKGNYERGILRILENEERSAGFAESSRANELFIFCSNKTEDFNPKNVKVADLIPIRPEAVKRFYDLADLRTDEDESLPFHPVGTNRNNGNDGDKVRLKTGDLVYFRATKIIEEEKEKEYVTEISFSAIWRDLVGQGNKVTKIKEADTTFDFFQNIDDELLPFNKDREQITFAEQMFGLVENNGDEKTDDEKLSLAGRIYPSVANWKGIIENGKLNDSTTDFYDLGGAEDDGLTLLKILASPKPPSPAMYFKSGYIAKNQLNAEQHQPQGRKFYLHNKSNEGRPWETKKPTENQKQKMKVKPVKANSVFSFYVDFENLSELELGALLYALRPSEEFRHKLGLGKPIGLGTVKIDVVELLKIDRAKRYSHLGLFEKRDESISSQIETLRSAFRASNPNVCSILETIGDPEKVIEKVQYPTRNRQSDEGENFKWFVENDRNRNRNLLPIRESQNIPSLEEY